MVAVASSLVGSLAASWAGSRAVLVKPVAKLTKLANRRIEIRRMLVLAKPVARRIEQLRQMVAAAVVNSSGGRQVDRSNSVSWVATLTIGRKTFHEFLLLEMYVVFAPRILDHHHRREASQCV